jgi:hypothetical protein
MIAFNDLKRNGRRVAYEVEVGILEGDAACIAPTELAGVIRQETVVTRGREECSGYDFGDER